MLSEARVGSYERVDFVAAGSGAAQSRSLYNDESSPCAAGGFKQCRCHASLFHYCLLVIQDYFCSAQHNEGMHEEI